MIVYPIDVLNYPYENIGLLEEALFTFQILQLQNNLLGHTFKVFTLASSNDKANIEIERIPNIVSHTTDPS